MRAILLAAVLLFAIFAGPSVFAESSSICEGIAAGKFDSKYVVIGAAKGMPENGRNVALCFLNYSLLFQVVIDNACILESTNVQILDELTKKYYELESIGSCSP